MTKMMKPQTGSIEARVKALETRHARLEQEIQTEQRRPLPSMSRLRALKSRKLMLKDEMAYYGGVLQTLASMDGRNPQGAA